LQSKELSNIIIGNKLSYNLDVIFSSLNMNYMTLKYNYMTLNTNTLM